MAVRRTAGSHGSTDFIRATCSIACWRASRRGSERRRPSEAWRRGLAVLRGCTDRARRHATVHAGSRYPIDGQCVAQAIQTLSLAAVREPWVAGIRGRCCGSRSSRWARRRGIWLSARPLVGESHRASAMGGGSPMLAALTQHDLWGRVKQVTQRLRNGRIEILDVPEPSFTPDGVHRRCAREPFERRDRAQHDRGRAAEPGRQSPSPAGSSTCSD